MADLAEEALLGLVRDLAEEIAAGYAVELAAAAAPPAQAPAPAGIPSPKKGPAAVHPHLGGHLLGRPGDSVSGHAYAHVPRMFPVKPPDARDNVIAGLHQTLGIHRQAELQRMADEQAAAKAQRTGIPAPGTYAPLDDDAYAAHAARAGKSVAASLEAGHATSASETLDGHGQVWKPERAAAHNEIVQQLLDKAAAVPSEGRAVLLGGLPGPGKAAVAKKAVDPSRYAVVSPGQIKQELAKRGMVPEAEGLSPGERSALVHEEAGHVANLAVSRLAASGKNLALDIPVSSEQSARGHLDRLRRHGYRVHGVFAHVPAAAAAQDADARHRAGLEAYRQGKDPAGPSGPGDLIRAAETGPGSTVNKDTFDALRGELGSWERWDAAGGKPVLAEKSGEPRGHGITSVEDLVKRGTT
jgi:predicted kinase